MPGAVAGRDRAAARKAGRSLARAAGRCPPGDARRGRRVPVRPGRRRPRPARSGSSNRPASMAAIAFCWLARAKASWRSRLTAQRSATFSPVSPIDSGLCRSARRRVDEPPAQGGVLQLVAATIPGGRRLGHDARRAGHRLDAAADEHVAVADLDGVGRRVDRLQAAAAQAVDGQAADLDRQVRPGGGPSGPRRGCPHRPGWRSPG